MNMAHENVSPWLREVKRTRPVIALSEDVDSDVAIVGGGISGVATSYFLLRDTSLSVDLIEKGRVAHGATGHNGGQAVAAFERPIIELCEKFGEEKVSEGLLAINGAWKLLRSIISETGINASLQEVTAYLGLSSLEDIHDHAQGEAALRSVRSSQPGHIAGRGRCRRHSRENTNSCLREGRERNWTSFS